MKGPSRYFVTAGVGLLLLLAGCSNSGHTTAGEGKPDGTGVSGDFSTELIASKGSFPAVAVDGDGNPHVCFYDYTSGYVMYASRTTAGWKLTQIERVADDDGSIGDGGRCFIAVDSSGDPYLCYYSFRDSQFKHAALSGSTWTINTIALPVDPDSSSGQPYTPSYNCSIAVDAAGNAHLAVGMWGTMGAALGYWKTGMAEAVVVDSLYGNTGRHNAIAVDGDGNPHIVYENGQSPNLHYAFWNGSSFDIQTIGPMSLVYWETRLSALYMDSNNLPHAFYYNDKFVHAYSDGTTWITENIPYSSSYPSLSMAGDPTDQPHVAFVAADTGSLTWLIHGQRTSSGWVFDNVEDDASDTDACSIAVDAAGGVHIVYARQESSDTSVKYAYRQ